MIIDAHCSIGKGMDSALAADDLLRLMDANGVDKALVGPVDRFLAVYNREGNDYLLAEAATSRGRLYALATANPWYGEKGVEELRRALDAGAVGVEFHPALQGFRITDAVACPILEVAAEYDRPVYFHTGAPVCAMPFQLTELAMRFPHVMLVMGRMAFSDFWNDVAAAAAAVENVYLETSFHWPAFVADVKAAVGARRIMYGSGAPANAMDLEIEKIRRAVSDEADLNMILGGTAASVFRGVADGS